MATSAKARRQPQAARGEWKPARFLRETMEELRKVVWPTAAELYRYTIVVISTVVVISLFIGVVDFGVGEMVKRFVYNALANPK
jgi:preprotein translocase subunit SecE